MVFVFGSRLYGKVDNVKGLFYVATKFGHFDYFPLFPAGSWIVTEKTGNGWRGVPIPVSFKSILMGWLRAVAVLAIVLGAVGMVAAIDEMSNARGTPARVLSGGRVIPARPGSNGPLIAATLSGAVIAGALFILIGSRYVPGLGKASPRRAEELGRMLGLDEATLDMLRRNQYDLPPSSGFEVLPAKGLQEVSAGGH